MNLAKGSDKDSGSRKGPRHYGKHTIYSFGQRAVLPFIIPTARRWEQESQPADPSSIDDVVEKEPSKKNFLEDVISDCATNMTLPVQLAAVFVQPWLLGIGCATNMVSYAYEKRKRQIQPDRRPEQKRTAGHFRSIPSRFVDYFRNIPARLKRGLKRLPRKLGIFLSTYAVVGALCFGHYNATKETQNPGAVNVTATSCELKRKDQRYRFTLLGEAHYYNKSSTEAARRILDSEKNDMVLSEGTSEQPNIEEKILFTGLLPFIWGLGAQEPDISTVAYKQGLPVIYIEGRYDDGRREGVSKASNTLLAVMGGIAITKGPMMYIIGASMRHMGANLNPKAKDSTLLTRFAETAGSAMGIIHERNRLMTENFIYHMDMYPGTKPLIRVGEAHVDGVIKEFKKYGELTCEKR
ncbi:hypothetical protein ACFL3V_00055 [Nanoarchaeota archaeon]